MAFQPRAVVSNPPLPLAIYRIEAGGNAKRDPPSLSSIPTTSLARVRLEGPERFPGRRIDLPCGELFDSGTVVNSGETRHTV